MSCDSVDRRQLQGEHKDNRGRLHRREHYVPSHREGVVRNGHRSVDQQCGHELPTSGPLPVAPRPPTHPPEHPAGTGQRDQANLEICNNLEILV